jgi:hypothetical protein
VDDVFGSAGSLRAAYEAVDWAATPLGPVPEWSPTLVATVRMALRTRFAVTLMWGPEYVLVYNEAYVQMIADKHPAALGAPARHVFPEIWDTIGPMLDEAAAGEQGTWVTDLQLLMDRHGYLEETFFTFSYSAVAGPSGAIEGVIDIATETTEQVIGTRRLRLLYRLNEQLADVEDQQTLLDRALPVLESVPEDVDEVTVTDGPAPDGTTVLVRLDDTTLLTAHTSPHLADDEAYQGFCA